MGVAEPFEEVHIETSNETVGAVVEMSGSRRGRMMDMQTAGQGMTRITTLHHARPARFPLPVSSHPPRRGCHAFHFHGYDEMAGPMSTRTTGSLVAGRRVIQRPTR